MDSRVKSLIVKDYKEVFKNINQIVTGERINCLILKPQQYLYPTIITNILPLDDKYGEFYHYNQICETLEKLLAGEKVDYNGRFRDASEEIKNLLFFINTG